MKHHDCTCSACRKVVALQPPQPATRISIPLTDAPTVIAECLRAVLAAHGYEVIRWQGASGAVALGGQDLEQVLTEAATIITSALQGLSESTAPEPAAPRAARGRR